MTSITASEILELAKLQWAGNKEISIIGGKCLNYAINDRKKIEKIVKEKYGPDTNLPKAKVPMEEVINYYHINIGYLKKVCK